MAPEVLTRQGEESESWYTRLIKQQKADSWSFGCILYEVCMLKEAFNMLEGEAVFREKVLSGVFKSMAGYYSGNL